MSKDTTDSLMQDSGSLEYSESLPRNERTKSTGRYSRSGSSSGSVRTRKKSTMFSLQTQAERLKEKEAQAKEARDSRKNFLGSATHRFLLEMVADRLDLDSAVVEEFILDSQKHFDLMDEFFAKRGRRIILFYYQESDPLAVADCGRVYPTQRRGKLLRLFITDGTDEALNGKCVFFIRIRSEVHVTPKNIHEEILSGSMEVDPEDPSGILVAIHELLTEIYSPPVYSNADWGALNDSPQGVKTTRKFMDSYNRFLNFLEGAQGSIKGAIELKKCETYDLSELQSMSDCMRASTNPLALQQIEEVVTIWSKQIEQVLAESEQMRKEADDTGPLAELVHWRQLMARFNFLVEQIKSHDCRMAICVLNAAKSKVLKTWKEIDDRTTDAANEAKDNVKFLSTLEGFCESLYHADPANMTECLPSLINAIRMINSISRYYNTSERMTTLFIKVTNQIVTTCRNYISDGGLNRIWDLERETLVARLLNCIKLYNDYQDCFHNVKRKVEVTQGEKPFDFSEMYIFGKFTQFCQRLEKILELLNLMEMYSILPKTKIESMEPMASKYNHICAAIRKKPYDVLDPRKVEFDNDFADFKRYIADLEMNLKAFLDTQFRPNAHSMQSLKFLQRVEHLNLPALDVTEKYFLVFLRFGEEIEFIKKLYHKYRETPEIPRNMPPVAGKIAWARQLFHKLQEPMNYFRDKAEILNSPDGQKIVKNFNRTCCVLVEYELLYHRAWVREAESVRPALQAPLLVRAPQTEELIANFDPMIYMLIRETECIRKLNLPVPEIAKLVSHLQTRLKQDHNVIQVLLEENKECRKSLPLILRPLASPAIKNLDEALRPGLSVLGWMSLNLQKYFTNVTIAIDDLKLLITKVDEIRMYRVERTLEEMGNLLLCELPEDSSWTIEIFLSKTTKFSQEKGQVLSEKSAKVEQAVYEVMDLLLVKAGASFNAHHFDDDIKPAVPGSRRPTVVEAKLREISKTELEPPTAEAEKPTDGEQHLRQECKELFNYFNHRNLDAIVRSTRMSLDSIKRRVFFSSQLGGGVYDDDSKGAEAGCPFFHTEIVLEIPNVVIQPSLDDIQHAVSKASHIVLDVSREVMQWGQVRKSGHARFADSAKHCYKYVTDHKDIAKVMMMLGSSINAVRQKVSEILLQYNKYSFLWDEDRDEVLEEFMKTNPPLPEFLAKIRYYEQLETEIANIATSVRVGAIEMFTGPLKMSLSVEAKAWKFVYGKFLNLKYRQEKDDIAEFLNDMQKKLARPIKDLDDVRHAMAALSTIREKQIDIDMALSPIEEAYSMLQKFRISVSRDEMEQVDTLRYSVDRVLVQMVKVQDVLLAVQPKFKAELLTAVDELGKDVVEFVQSYDKAGPMCEGIEPREANLRLVVYQSRFDDLWRRLETCSGGEELFGLPQTEYPPLCRIRKELNLLQKLYGLYNAVMDSINGYYDILWTELDIEKINVEILDFQTKCRKLPKGMKDWKAFEELKQKIDDFNESCPLLEMMASKSMKARHWDRIAAVTGHKFDLESENFTLKKIMEAPLLEFKDDIEDICISSTKEKDIEAKLKQVILDWSTNALSFTTFKGRGELLLKGIETQEIVSLMEDSLMILSSLSSNRYNIPFKKDIQAWVHKLSNTSDIIENWLVVQNLWVYLEAVFVGGDIAKQLPKEAKRFQNIDKSWVKIMTKAHETPNVVQCCVGDEMLGQLFPHLLEQLELCQKSLTGYLEGKRLIFPRFFFVSDPALLEILGQASDSHTIQAHLLGVFENVARVQFHEKDYDRIIAVESKEGEKIILDHYISAKGHVEVWLGELLAMQRKSLHGVIREASIAINEANFDLLAFLKSFPAQVGLLGLQMLWTRDAQRALSHCRTDRRIMSQTNDYFLKMLNTLIDQTALDLTRVERVKYETLVTIHVHQRDIFNDLHKMHIRSPYDFEWQKQSRFYYQDDIDECVIRITDVDFIYQMEFLGCTERLVITPLTDRCYITLAQAIGLSMGGAPAGPAGTGKTETTKDMGKALGKYVVVFNCSDQMDFRGLGRIFKGLAQSGSWGCFDEFNRIELPVLSVAAQQIHIVLSAKKERKREFIFSDGDHVSLSPEFGIFITMNPGYAGRQELPENLKIQFRTVAMMVPDRQIIIRVKLASCGFIDNIILAQKFYTLYKLCEEQLSKQVHYDFGLRNILSVLRTLGANRRARPQDSESTIVLRGLVSMNLSKLIDEDEPLFMSLINDLFPGIQVESTTYEELQGCIQHQTEELGIMNPAPWNLKVNQLYETQMVRHGIMVLGPSGAGKTCCLQVLMKALTEHGTPHREMRMNPKAITASQMFGRLDVATNDWTDGIFSTLWRKTLKVKKGEHVWIILDGPVDAIWIENLNSVLDDNKTLTLANGDRIPMSPTCKLIFEVHNIDNASPATVSRNGMVFMSASVLNWRPILEAWLLQKPASEGHVLKDLFESVFDDLYIYVKQELNAMILILECNYIKQCIDLLSGLVPGKEEMSNLSPVHLERLFIFALMWSFGALLELDDRDKMEHFLREHENTLKLPEIPEGSGQTMFEFVVDADGQWEHWSNRVETYQYPSDSVPEYSSILIPNVDNVRSNFLIDTIAKQRKAVLLIGEQGTAKTVMIKAFMDKYQADYHMSKSFNFSSASTPMSFQRTIESYIEKRVGNTYGPPAGRKMTVFIDDINLPIINEWGDQITNEIVRQCMEMQGFYSLDKPGDFTVIADTQFLAAMIHPGGGRNDIPERLKRAFSIFNCTLPSNASIDKIFGIIGCGYFCSSRFVPEVVDFVAQLVPATRMLWQQTKVKMLPTPGKFHYVFNLRDLSRIWQGMLNVHGDECQTVLSLLGLWKHECSRVISDRFVNAEDRKWFDQSMVKVMQSLDEEYGLEVEEVEPCYVDFLRDAPEPTGEDIEEDFDFEAPKIYEQIPDYETLTERLQMYMHSYNEQIRGAGMDIVFFRDAMIHLTKISRIIRTPRGNAMLVGVGGSGKQTLTRLASFIAGYKIFQITLTRSYSISNLMDDLKYLYKVAGLEGHGITFIFTDNEIKEEAFLEYINNVLSSGEVSNLFARDEIDEITTELIPVMKSEFPRVPPTQQNLYDYFIARARNNLHVVLCFSPVSEKFHNRALKFPGLISGCTMDWFNRWPKDALIAVANHFLSDYQIACTEDHKKQLIETMGVIHDGVEQTCVDYFHRFRRRTHVTPKSYLSFIGGYKTIYTEGHQHIGDLAKRMNTGLNKLYEASESVAKLSEELAEKEKELEIASEKADKVLVEVTASAAAAEKVKNAVLSVKERAQNIVNEISSERALAEEKLEKARPALEEAEAALQTIKPAHIATVRKLGKPPHLIMRIMDAALLLFQKKMIPIEPDAERPGCFKPSWGESLKMMSQTGFLQMLQNYNKDMINEEIVELMEPYLRQEDYTLESAKKVCGDVAGLLSWSKAMVVFYHINKEVLPLKANLALQEARLAVANGELDKAQAQLDEKQRELDVVQAQYDAAMFEKQTLLDDAEVCRRKMTTASALIGGLGGEKARWTEQSKQFEAQIERLIGNVLLCTGFLSYSGPFNQEFRSLLLKKWKKQLTNRKIPFSTDINISNMLVDAPTIGEWNLQGLPNDDLSIQNGIITTKATRFPLLIDPQSQAKIWIKNAEAKNSLQVTHLNHKYFRTHLEDCLSLGKPMLIEDVGEELDPALDNVLEKNFIKSGTGYKVKVGDKEIDVMKGFYLYITTKLPNPSYTPEISARTSIIDFTVTMKGLEEQLLGRVIMTEKQELEAEKTKLMEDVNANKRRMQELEDNLLYKLTSTKGSLVDDESLIEVLANTKQTASEVNEKLIVAADNEAMIDSAREEFRPVATRGSILYFLIVEMSLVNVMYQTSLKQFLSVFDLSMARSTKSPIPTKRIANIIEYLTYEVFKYTCRGLYENHKFLFTLLLALKIDMQRGKVKHDEFQTLIKGGAALDLKAVAPKPCKWISDMTWLNLVELSKLYQFAEILTQIPRNEKGWRIWFDKDAPEEEQIPDGYHTSLDTFRKLLLVRCWCPDRTIPQARKYISDAVGEKYADPVILNLEATWAESDVRTPMICFLSLGSDPTNQIEALARKLQFDYRAISMGQGQEVHARRLINQCIQQGGWVLLQNCHLGLEFMEELLEIMFGIGPSCHETFRIWITTDVHKDFPISLLQISIKFTNEPPQGIKAGLTRTYASITPDYLDISSLYQWKPLLYCVSFLHTTVQERRKFGPLGWNIPYEFNSADWSSSCQFIQNHLDDLDIKKGVSWVTVRYMLGEVHYGGRVTDDYDKRLLNTICRVWFGEHMFQDNFAFYTGYKIPKCKTLEQFMQAIDELPQIDSPQALGLHPNADITYQSNTAKEVLDTIMNIQPKETVGGGGETRESVVFKMAEDMLSKLPPSYVPHEVKARLQTMGALCSMNIFLRQEIDRIQKVISTVRVTLMDLKLAIEGTIVMSENLRDALNNMYDARIPKIWLKISWESSTLGFWFTELIERNHQFHSWLFVGRPKVFWMTGFFNAQGFLTAMRQEVTRAHKGWALDQVTLHNDVLKHYKDDVMQPPQEGVYVYGLYIDGAGWERRNCRLTEATPKALFTQLPVIHLYAINSVAPKDPKLYECPVYKKPKRTDLTYITPVWLRTVQNPDHWILRGVALLCDVK